MGAWWSRRVLRWLSPRGQASLNHVDREFHGSHGVACHLAGSAEQRAGPGDSDVGRYTLAEQQLERGVHCCDVASRLGLQVLGAHRIPVSILASIAVHAASI